jgi:kynurenine formamidase
MTRIIDLTLTLRHGMRGVEFETLHTVSAHGWNSRTLHLYSHSGTHMDAPHHFEAGTGTIDQIPLEDCLMAAWVANNLEEVTIMHRILLGGGIVIVEGLTNLEALRQERVFFGALPLKIDGGDGSPCRAFAMEGLAWGAPPAAAP